MGNSLARSRAFRQNPKQSRVGSAERMRGSLSWPVIGGIVAIATLALGILVWFYPRYEDARKAVHPPDLRYAVTSGNTASPVALSGLHIWRAKKEIQVSMTSLLVVNVGADSLQDPIRIMGDQLSEPILYSQMISYKLPLFNVATCEGKGAPETQLEGKRQFCILVSGFPPRSSVTVFLLFDSRRHPSIPDGRIWVVNAKTGEQARHLFTE